jgi:hypothetical protein
MSIQLVNIASVGNNLFRLDFQDGATSVSFVLEDVPRKGVRMTREFTDHFRGRASCREAMVALGRFADGEHVEFPVEVREDGYTGIFR